MTEKEKSYISAFRKHFNESSKFASDEDILSSSNELYYDMYNEGYNHALAWAAENAKILSTDPFDTELNNKEHDEILNWSNKLTVSKQSILKGKL